MKYAYKIGLLFASFFIGVSYCSKGEEASGLSTLNADQPQSTRQGEDSVLKRRIRSELGSADCRRIAQYCRALVCDRLERGKLSDEAISRTLKDKDLLFAVHLARYFSQPEVQKKTPCKALQDASFADWLVNNPGIVEDLAFSNRDHGGILDWLHTIWQQENGKLEGPLLNLAVGVALNAGAYPDEVLQAKYDFYKQSYANDALFPVFKDLKPWEMSVVLQTINNIGQVEDFAWGQQYLSKRPKITEKNIGNAACGLIPYRDKNKDGISVHTGGAFYDHKPVSLQIYTEYGGVCGAVSKGSSGFCRAKGVPAFPVGQPGHCALVWRQPGSHWVIGNNVCGGWNWAQGSGPIPWSGAGATILALEHFLSMDNAKESMDAYYCSQLVSQPDRSASLLSYSLRQNRKNYLAWKTKLDRLKKDKSASPQELEMVGGELNAAFGEEPAVLEHLVNKDFAPCSKKMSRLQLAALMLNKIDSGESRDIYLRNLWPQAVKNIPELADMKIKYDHKTSSSLLSAWEEFYKKNSKPKSRTRPQTCSFLEETISSLGSHRKTHDEMLSFYLKLLTLWKDNGVLLTKASEFIDTMLKDDKEPEMLKSRLEFGIQVETMRGEKVKVKKYKDRLDSMKST